MMSEYNVSQNKNLVCKHRNEISREIQERLKAKVGWPSNAYQYQHNTTLQADQIRRKTEERRYQKMADAARRKEQELQRKAEQEVIDRINKKVNMNGATIDWNVVQI